MACFDDLLQDLRILILKLAKIYIMHLIYLVGLFLHPKSQLIVEIVDLVSDLYKLSNDDFQERMSNQKENKPLS